MGHLKIWYSMAIGISRNETKRNRNEKKHFKEQIALKINYFFTGGNKYDLFRIICIPGIIIDRDNENIYFHQTIHTSLC